MDEKELEKMTKLEIKSTNICSRCKDLNKINNIKIDEKENILKTSYICDCGQIDWHSTKIKFI